MINAKFESFILHELWQAYAIKLDIQGYFMSLNHDKPMENIAVRGKRASDISTMVVMLMTFLLLYP